MPDTINYTICKIWGGTSLKFCGVHRNNTNKSGHKLVGSKVKNTNKKTKRFLKNIIIPKSKIIIINNKKINNDYYLNQI